MNSNIRDLTRIIQPAPMNKKILLFLIVFCFLFINSTVFAATYYVDTINGTNQVGCGSAQGISACKTIQYTETNVLSDNDTAYVAAGTYQEAYSSSYGLILGKAVIWIASGTVIITSSSQRSTAI